MSNDIFEPITLTFSTCKKSCQHICGVQPYDLGDCYYNNIKFNRELLKLKLQNIPDKMKIKDTKYDYYWINKKILISLIDIFVILITRLETHYTDRTPVYLLK